MKWKILNNPVNDKKNTINNILTILLENRGIKTKKEIDNFLNPKISDVTIESVGIDKKDLKKSLIRIKKAIKNKEKIIIYGDYDVDGICGTAILWETLFKLGANVDPYIPNRVEEGYGLSKIGIENLIKNEKEKISLIVTVDNGIVANDAVLFANSHEIEVIITDHHTTSEKLPNAFSIIHSTKICGAAVAWLFSQEIENKKNIDFLDLVTLATIADLVPLKDENRSIVKKGLEFVRKTSRVGLQALYQEAGIDPFKIGVYEIGHIISPRLNAMGRLESAMDSLRLVCTKNKKRAYDLALILSKTNRERQLLTQGFTMRAIEKVKTMGKDLNKIIVLEDNFEEGIIGLVAGRLVEYFYKPSIVIAKKDEISKASARSVSGFNIIEFIRLHSNFLVNAGGHPMAAGFSIETVKIPLLKEQMYKSALIEITDEQLEKILKIDLEILLDIVNIDLYNEILKLSPFGMGNFEPIFKASNVKINEIKYIGKEKKHVKIKFDILNTNKKIDGIGFNIADSFKDIKGGDLIDLAFSIDKNIWNNIENLQLKIKDIKKLN